jgi:hypothetical protein
MMDAMLSDPRALGFLSIIQQCRWFAMMDRYSEGFLRYIVVDQTPHACHVSHMGTAISPRGDRLKNRVLHWQRTHHACSQYDPIG